MTTQVFPPPATLLTDSIVVPLTFDTRAIAVRVLLTPLVSPAVSASSSVTNPSVSSPLHSALSSTMSSRSLPSSQYFPPALSLLTCDPPVWFCLPLIHASVICISAVFLFAALILRHVAPLPSLIISPNQLPSTPPSLGLLHSPCSARSSPRSPRPLPWHRLPILICNDKDFVNQTGRGEACYSVADGSVPRGNCPNMPLAVVGDGINRPLFLHWTQKYHPVHCRPAFAAIARTGGWARSGAGRVTVQLHYSSNGSWTRLIDGRLTV